MCLNRDKTLLKLMEEYHHQQILWNKFKIRKRRKHHSHGANLEIDEDECNIDEDFDNERYTGKVINNSFINKLKDFSTFNPSGNKGKERDTIVQ